MFTPPCRHAAGPVAARGGAAYNAVLHSCQHWLWRSPATRGQLTFSTISRATASPASTLQDWVLKEGGQVSQVHIVRSPDAGYGLVAGSDVAPGQKLIQLPPHCQLTYDAATDPRLLQVINKVPKELWGAKLALQLLAHRLQGTESRFASYISQLPVGYTVPMFFTAEGQAAIQYPPVGEQVKKRCRWLYDFSTKTLAGLPGTPADPFDNILVDINALGWALASVTSRAFRVRGPSEPAALLPLIDMCNHSFDPNCEVLPVDGQKGHIAMFAKRQIKAGEPLLLSYGPLSNDFLFMDYGFLIPDNPHDRVVLRFDMDLLEAGAELGKARGVDGQQLTQLTLAPWKKKWLTQVGLMGPKSNLEVSLGGPGLVDSRLLGAVRVAVAHSEADIKGRSVQQLGDLKCPLNRANETTALRILMGSALLALSSFPTTLATDTALLAGTPPTDTTTTQQPLTPDLKLAVSFRAEKKRLLTQVVQALGERVQALKEDTSLPATSASLSSKGQPPVAASSKGFGSRPK